MRFLVALDGTDASEDAFEHALELAVGLDASLLLAYAVEPASHVTDEDAGDGDDPEEAEAGFVRGVLEDARTRGDRLLNDAARRARTAGVRVDTRIVEGEPLDVLPSLAEEVAADGVVVGHRRPDPAETVIDSVAKGLIDRSPVPVTVVTASE